MGTRELQEIHLVPALKVVAAVAAPLGVLWYAIQLATAPSSETAYAGIETIVIGFVISAVGAVVISIVGATISVLVYNAASSQVGGLEIEVE